MIYDGGDGVVDGFGGGSSGGNKNRGSGRGRGKTGGWDYCCQVEDKWKREIKQKAKSKNMKMKKIFKIKI